jgi:AraC-like DNA-binding protein
MIESMSELEARRDESNRRELVSRIAKHVGEDGTVEALPGLHLYRLSAPSDRIYGASRLSLCVIAQGAKTVTLGERDYRYDAERYLLATVELPVAGRIVEASQELPYLSLRLDLDPTLVGSVMVEAGIPAPQGHRDAKAIVVSTLDPALLDATVRLLRLIGSPTEARVLGPLVKREIVFRLLMCEQGNRLRHLPALGGHSHRIAQAIERLQKSFDQPLRIESLAQELGMSSSGFHHHFKAVTDMSPLQFQKQMRLQEARRLMLGESLDAGSAGYRVGYEDPSHFSRDYKKHFGQSPIRDVERLRGMSIAE